MYTDSLVPVQLNPATTQAADGLVLISAYYQTAPGHEQQCIPSHRCCSRTKHTPANYKLNQDLKPGKTKQPNLQNRKLITSSRRVGLKTGKNHCEIQKKKNRTQASRAHHESRLQGSSHAMQAMLSSSAQIGGASPTLSILSASMCQPRYRSRKDSPMSRCNSSMYDAARAMS